MEKYLLNLEIDRSDPTPLYYQIKKQILTLIKNNVLKKDSPLPPEMELVAKYKVSRTVVGHALSDLAKEGYLYRIRGKGTFVAEPKKNTKQETHNIKTIGLIVADLAISFHSDIARAIEDEAHKRDYQIILGNSDNNAQKEEAYMYRFANQKIKGIIVVTGKNSLHNKYFQHLDNRIPFVIIDTFIDKVRADYVTTDDLTGAYEATKHLLDLGHRKIAYLAGRSDVSTSRIRLAGYKKALIEARIGFNEDLLKETDFTEESGYEAMKGFLAMENKPTAVFAVADMEAAGAIQAIREAGRQVPDDISVVGYGGLNNGLNTDISLTTVSQPAYEMGKIAARILFEKIKGKRSLSDIKEVILPTKLVVRASTRRCSSLKEAVNVS